MRTTSGSTRTACQLSESLLHQLNLYALAATAAGVASMALARSAEAKIVYTPANIKIPPPQRFNRTTVPLDLNHDGVGDFFFSNFFGGSAPNSYAFLDIKPSEFGNRALGKNGLASALPEGVRVRFNDATSSAVMGGWRTANGHSSTFAGQWANGGKGVKTRYLGLRFTIKGQIHFGWARLNVSFHKGEFSGTLTGYAYETIPNKPIITGKTKGKEAAGASVAGHSLGPRARKPATLGMLALGSGFDIWRRDPHPRSPGAIEPDANAGILGRHRLLWSKA
jgi:hypothetical protein